MPAYATGESHLRLFEVLAQCQSPRCKDHFTLELLRVEERAQANVCQRRGQGHPTRYYQLIPDSSCHFTSPERLLHRCGGEIKLYGGFGFGDDELRRAADADPELLRYQVA